MSTYNGEKYLAEQIDSILAQQGDFDLHLYIRDDGSRDGTANILRSYKKQDNIHVVFGENAGITASYFELLKTVLSEGRYQYFSLSDQDDVWLPDKLACAIRVLESVAAENLKQASDSENGGQFENIPLLYGCQSWLVDEKLKKTGKTTQRQYRPLTIRNTAIQNILLGHNQVFNEAFARELGGRILKYEEIFAHDMWITQVASVKGKIIFENTPHTLYRQHGSNELGYGSGPGTVKWFIARIRRARGGESRQVSRQLAYFLMVYEKELDLSERNDIRMFLASSKSLFKRVKAIARIRLYRQRPMETVLFKLLYLNGGYR